ncbi:MAG TPA: hypothetical protein VHU43_04605 [Steroidobacteraceae bacterium]|jgi:hypothetical protein|nr:hypothetical protein [Steroidobacteraceae bacterium]
MSVRTAALRVIGGLGAVIGYGCLAAFLFLISMQLYRWFRQGEWTHIGMGDGIRMGLVHCCVKNDGVGRIAAFLHWWESPANWLGLHKVFEVVPASLALFAAGIAGNSLFIFCRDRLLAGGQIQD